MWPSPSQVNGISMQGATHHEAVSALRNAGSCIKMKVLRERLLPRVVRDLDVSQDPRDAAGRQLCSQHGGGRSKQLKLESAEDCVSKKIEAVVCNGNGIVGGLLIYYIAHKTHFLNPSCFSTCHVWIKPSGNSTPLVILLHFFPICSVSLVSVWFGEWSEKDCVWAGGGGFNKKRFPSRGETDDDSKQISYPSFWNKAYRYYFSGKTCHQVARTTTDEIRCVLRHIRKSWNCPQVKISY